jgi:glyoxylase-like metal-dependent hydrolase (beta-lactamase superfamily II)
MAGRARPRTSPRSGAFARRQRVSLAAVTEPTAPIDPRTSWALPPFGALPVVEELDEVTTRVLAPNPSPMTLDGTNTYVVGAPGRGEVLVVDPGPDDPAHLARVREVLADRSAAVRAVVVTHHHVDHAEAALAWADTFGCTVIAAARAVAGPRGLTVGDGEPVALEGLEVRVIATPGHTRDHVALRLGTGAVLTGDHVLGRGTSVVTHPDGDLAAYLESNRRLLDLGPDALFPGHGPALTEDPSAVLVYYGEHREFRRRQILAALAEGPASPADLVARIYADVDRALWPAAESSTRAALEVLVAEGQVEPAGADRLALAR